MTESQSSFNILKQIIVSPRAAFVSLCGSYPVLLPLFLTLLASGLLVFCAFSNIDYEWFTEQMVETMAGGVSPSEQAQVRDTFEMMSPKVMSVVSVFSVVLTMVILFCLHSLYFVIVSNITDDGFQFKQWFCFVSWSSLPGLISILASLLIIFSSEDGRYLIDSLDPLSINALFVGMDATQGVGKVFASISLTLFWTVGLMVVGYSVWTQKRLLQSFIIVVLPYIGYFGFQFYLNS
jgi:hypothetical protein